MTDTNALAEGAASTSSEQTENAQSSAETTQTAQSSEGKPEGEQKPEAGDRKSRQPSERIKELAKERNETEVALFAEKQKTRAATNEIRRLSKMLSEANLTDTQRAALELRVEDKRQEMSETEGQIQEKQDEAKSKRLELFSEKVGDEKIVDAFCRLRRVSEELAEAVVTSDYAAELAAKLANNPSLARRLSGLPPVQLGGEIARMEYALAQSPAVRSVSQAPEPSATLKGGSSPAAKSLTDPSLSMEEYAERRKADMRKAAQR